MENYFLNRLERFPVLLERASLHLQYEITWILLITATTTTKYAPPGSSMQGIAYGCCFFVKG